MQKTFILILLLFIVGLSSCTVKKRLEIVDGSKADGTLTMAYTIKANQKAKFILEEARQEAVVKCKQWGYSDAEIFTAGMRECIDYRQLQCVRYMVKYKCQCID